MFSCSRIIFIPSLVKFDHPVKYTRTQAQREREREMLISKALYFSFKKGSKPKIKKIIKHISKHSRIKEEMNILHTSKRRKADWTGHVLRRNCLLKHFIEGKIDGTGRRGRIRKQLLDGLKETRRPWKLKEEALDRTVWRTGFGGYYGPVVRQTAF